MAGGTTADGTTGGTTAADEDGQQDIVRSKAEEPDRSSCIKRHSRLAVEASVDATDADVWGDPP